MSEDEIKKIEMRGYSRGYQAGRKRGELEAKKHQREAARAIVNTIAPQPSTRDPRALLLQGLAKEIDKAAAQGRIHVWEHVAHSIIDFIASQHQTSAATLPKGEGRGD